MPVAITVARVGPKCLTSTDERRKTKSRSADLESGIVVVGVRQGEVEQKPVEDVRPGTGSSIR